MIEINKRGKGTLMDYRIVTIHSLTQLIDRMYPGLITKQDLTVMLQTLKTHRRVSLKEIADLILYIADTSHREWNIEVVLNSINEVFDSINWRGVYEKFIEEDLKIWNTEYLYTLVDCWVHISGIITVPYEVFFRRWINRENQIDFLRILLESDERRTQVYSNIFFEKIVTKEEIRSSKFKKTIEYESNLNSIELFKSIKEIEAVEIIDFIKEKSPEYCILGLAAVQPFCESIFDDLFVCFCEGTTSNFVYHVLFTKHRTYMLQAFERVYDRISLTRTLDIFLEHKMLPGVTELLEPKNLCFDIIILSSRRDHLNLEVWLNNNFAGCSRDFISYFYHKLLTAKRPQDSGSTGIRTNDDVEGTDDAGNITLRNDNEIFPFNKNIINNVLKIIEDKELTEESQSKINEIKRQLSDHKVFDKTSSSDRATQFISEIINSQIEVEDSIFKLKELLRGDETSHSFVKSIFGLLIDNYSNLYKLPNSDMLAVFFGELIKRKIFLKPFMKVALQLVKNSLKFPESEREYAFAFRILEIFLIENPEFFVEVESIESVRIGLIKKELILIDEDAQTPTDLDRTLQTVLGIEDMAEYNEFLIKNNITQCGSAVRGGGMCQGDGAARSSSVRRGGSQGPGNEPFEMTENGAALEAEDTVIGGFERAFSKLELRESMMNRDGTYVDCESKSVNPIYYNLETAPKSTLLAFYIFKNLTMESQDLFVRFVGQQGGAFRDFLVEAGFKVLKSCFVYKMENELEFYCSLGSFLGVLVLAQNRPVKLDVFDFKNFILKSIEYRRITVCVSVVACILKQGRRGIIYVPNNPWLMSIMDLLAELHSCTLIHVRETILDLFSHFSVKLAIRPAYRMKEHLIKYEVPYDGILRQVISSALDFSVREICNKVVKSSLNVSKITAVAIFSRIVKSYVLSGNINDTRPNGVRCCLNCDNFFKNGSKNFFIFRNLFVNLTRALIHISAQEPLKASICGNVTHFLKLSVNDLALDEVYQLATANLKTCCSLIEKVGITQVNEVALHIYESMMNDLHHEYVIQLENRRGSAASNASDQEKCDENHLGDQHGGSGVCDREKTPDDARDTETEKANINLSSMMCSTNFINNLKILNETNFVEKTHVRSIENSEYQEIRSFLIQIGRKMPLKKKDFISEEWPLLLGGQREEHFRKMVSFLESVSDRDAQCLSLCKYLVGHAIKTGCREEFVFEFIVRVLEVSPKTKREVVGWLIYSDDCKRHNIPLIKRFIEYDLIYLEEFDQALARSLKNDDYKTLYFTLDLLGVLMIGPIKLCTVYDFIHTIETLNKMNDNPRVFEFFKKIELGMMKFTESSDSSFDTALKTLRLNVSADQVRARFKERYVLNFKAAMKSAWHHFVLYSGSYRFFKVDVLALLSKDIFVEALKESLSLLVQAYSKCHYLFFMFYCRFFVKLLDGIEDNLENRTRVAKILEILSPSSLPGFSAQFIEILDHRFLAKHLARSDAFFIFRDLITLISANDRYVPLVTAFFSRNIVHTRRHAIYLSYICPETFPVLKNVFNQTRPRTYAEKGSNPFFSTFYFLCRQVRINTDYNILIDNLCEHNSSTIYALDRLRTMLDRGIDRNKIILSLLIRSAVPQTPPGITLACEELFARRDIQEIVDRLSTRFFHKNN